MVMWRQGDGQLLYLVLCTPQVQAAVRGEGEVPTEVDDIPLLQRKLCDRIARGSFDEAESKRGGLG